MVQLTKWGELTFDHASLRILNNRTAFCFRHGERRSTDVVWQQRDPSLATQTNRELPERRFWSSFRKIYGEMIPSTRWLLCWCCLLRLDWNCKLALCIVSRALSHRYDLQRVPVYDTARMWIDGAHEKNLWRRQKPMQTRNFHFPDSLQSVFPLTIVSLFARR